MLLTRLLIIIFLLKSTPKFIFIVLTLYIYVLYVFCH
nr:MAG TPA: hypothetical protein [Caudoviricetes sp.]